MFRLGLLVGLPLYTLVAVSSVNAGIPALMIIPTIILFTYVQEGL